MIWRKVSWETLLLSMEYQKVFLHYYARADKDEKHRREMEAMDHLVSLLPDTLASSAAYLRELYDEYELGVSREAIVVKDVDKYELLVQAVEYERDSVNRGEKLEGLRDLTSFFGMRHGIKTDLVKGLAADIMKEREDLWKKASSHIVNGINGN